MIGMVEVEDCSGESWNILGYLWPKQIAGRSSIPATQHKIYYRTDTRRGNFVPTEK